MKASFFERFVAYVVDIVIIGALCTLVIAIIPHQDTTVLKNELAQLRTQYASKEISYEAYSKTAADLYYQIDGVNIPQKTITIIITMCYFMYYQYRTNGKTIGKKMMKIRIVKENGDISLNDIVYRSLLVNGVIFSIMAIGIIFISNRGAYYNSKIIIDGAQLACMFIIGVMVLYRKDKRGIHDLLTNTKVISER